MVQVGGQVWKRHVNQLLMSQVDFQRDVVQDVLSESVPIVAQDIVPPPDKSPDKISESTVTDVTPSISSAPEQNVTLAPEDSAVKFASTKIYPQRSRTPPTYLKDYIHKNSFEQSE